MWNGVESRVTDLGHRPERTETCRGATTTALRHWRRQSQATHLLNEWPVAEFVPAAAYVVRLLRSYMLRMFFFCMHDAAATRGQYLAFEQGLMISFFITAHGSNGSIVYIVIAKFFFSVNAITHKTLHLARWNFAWTCTLTTSRSLLNIKVIGQRSGSHEYAYVLCMFFITVKTCFFYL